ncbi:MAG TPA: hypothetical protein DEO50_11200 [Erysipelotrichaceae bacterium]|nr:MAG: hypothetical protein A2Y19_05520 [Firmicutes bacterium GWE2_51_13]HBZ42420.1 hypothetical protein [Erysipelotrichaceae bacterium]
MKKCEVCGEPIAAHKVVDYPFRLVDKYKCPKCKSEYVFKDNWLHIVLAIAIFIASGVLLQYALLYDLTKTLVTIIVTTYFTFFVHLFLRSKMVFTSIKILTNNDQILDENEHFIRVE